MVNVRVYIPRGTEGTVYVGAPPEDNMDLDNRWDCFHQRAAINAADWRSPTVIMHWHNDNSRKKLKMTDFIDSGFGCLIFNQKVIDVLGDVLTRCGQILPLACADLPLFTLNVTRIIDCIDLEKCDKTRPEQPVGANGSNIFDPSFFSERLVDEEIFRVPQTLITKTFVTEVFLKRVEAAGLTGLSGRIIFDSDGPLPWQRA